MLTGLIPPSIAADQGRPTGGATTGQPTSYTLLRYARKRDSTDTSHLTTTRTTPRTQLPCQTRRGHSSSSESQFTRASEASQRTWGGCLFLRRQTSVFTLLVYGIYIYVLYIQYSTAQHSKRLAPAGVPIGRRRLNVGNQ
jgi:hypothetical protein